MNTYPLTETMLGMFLEWNENQESARYTVAVGNRFPLSVDADRLVRAVEDAVAANPVFQIRIVESDSGFRWTVDEAVKIKVSRSSMSDSAAEKYVRSFAKGFDALNGPLARFELVETPSCRYLLSELFHLITDGTSLRLFFNEIEARYTDAKLPFKCKNILALEKYSLHEADSFETPEYIEAKSAAAARFSGRSMTIPDYKADHCFADRPFIKCEIRIPRIDVDSFCRTNALDANRYFMGVFARTLALFSNQKDVVFWTVNHGRGKNDELKTASGCFVKTVPVLGELKADESIIDYFRSFHLHKAGVYPFTHFCRDLGIKPGLGFVYQDGATDYQLNLGSLHSEYLTPMTGGAGEMPVLQVFGGGDDFVLEMTCSPGRYDEAFLSDFLKRLHVISDNFLHGQEGNCRLADVPLVSSDECEQLLDLSYGGQLEYDRTETFVDLFHKQTSVRPDAIAVVASDGQLTYRDLEERSNAVAAALIENDVRPGEFVAVKLPRSVLFPIAVLAIQKCGCGYVPLDPEYPVDRLEYMIEDSGAKVVIDGAWSKEYGAWSKEHGAGSKEHVCGSRENGQKRAYRTLRIEHLLGGRKFPAVNMANPALPAYMIYTSGSTGKPKGVVVPHRALTNLIKWFERDFQLGYGKKNIHLASFSFDASVPDIFATLACGAELHILDEDARKDLQSVGEYCTKNGITGAVMSTQMGLALVNTYPGLPLDYMMLGGEKMVSFAKTPVRMLNGYGPTEFCVCSSFHEVDQSKTYDIPIGRPVPNTWSFIVDPLGQLVPMGMVGEIALAGIQLADGYWNKPEKTEQVFVSEKLKVKSKKLKKKVEEIEREYRTGDFGRYNADGELEFLGRVDFQVKLRGFRIEIGEIEHTASTYPGIGRVIAMVRKVSGTDHLVLYYDLSSESRVQSSEVHVQSSGVEKQGPGAEIDVGRLREYLKKSLTAYMVPDYYVELDKMPLTPGGKIDRNALPLPKTVDEAVVAPQNDLEKGILSAVCSVLQRDDVGVTHDFNDIGLTSLGAMALVVRLKNSIGVKVSMRQLADNPSVRRLAEFLENSSGADLAIPAPVATPRRPRRASYPMTETQRGIYADWLKYPDTTQYNIPVAVRFPTLDARALADATAKVIRAHESFSVQFTEANGEIVQKPVLDGFCNVPVEKLDFEPDSNYFTERMNPFKPVDAPLARAMVFSAPNASYLFLDIHHTVFDGYSVGIFMNELARVFDGKDPLGEKYSSLDAALDERDYIESTLPEEDDLWFSAYLGDLESTRIETSPHGVSTRAGKAGRVKQSLPSEIINSRCRSLGITPSDFFLTVFTELLKRVGRSDNILINFISAGRSNPDTSATTGMFVKTLPLKGVKDAVSFEKAARQIHTDVIDLVDHERVSYARLAEKFGIRPDILFAFEGGIFELPQGAELLAPETDTVKTPFTVVVTPAGGSFDIVFEYDCSLYAKDDMSRLLAMFATLSENAVSTDDLRAMPLVPGNEAEKILSVSFGGKLDYDRNLTFVDSFLVNAAANPDAIAVVDCEKSIIYGELDARSNELAASLIAEGVEPGGYVGIMLPRRVEFIIAVIAVQKCGAGYIPIDPEYPKERIDYIVDNSGAKVVIDDVRSKEEEVGSKEYGVRSKEYGVGSKEQGAWSKEHGVGSKEHVCGSRENGQKRAYRTLRIEHLSGCRKFPAVNMAKPALPAYMIYTSGSTGKPKGVSISHRALSSMIAWAVRDFEYTKSDRVVLHPSFSFDASVINIFPVLAAGAQLHIFRESIRKDLSGMRDYIVDHEITCGGGMPTQIGIALLSAYPDLPIRNIMFGGEKLMPFAKTDVKVFNGYGPTEFCVDSSYEIVDQKKEGDIPIGRPVANTYSVIVDRYGQLMPLGSLGELALIGPQIADGYWNNPEKTKQVFVPIPFKVKSEKVKVKSILTAGSAKVQGVGDDLCWKSSASDSLMYRTGDLARYNADGKLEYSGRIDYQVKLRGFRIEIGEIESVAKKYPGIGSVAAEVREVGGTKHLVLYYEISSGVKVQSSELKAHLQKSLAAYMVPDYYVELDTMPMTPNGKINRKLLKAPVPSRSENEYVEPANDTERKIAAAFAQALKCDRFGATDDFFDRGGTSIVAIMAVIAVQKAGLNIQYGDIFNYKTPRALSGFLNGTSENSSEKTVSEQSDPFSSYDYSAINELLASTGTELFKGFNTHSLGTVLLTGATGYLGMHVLKYLLEYTSSDVYVLVRSKKGIDARRRIDSQYVYYFGGRLPAGFRDRLAFVEGDITDADLADKISASGAAISTVINCAALVKHYAADSLMDSVNVGGVENLIAFCRKAGACLIHTSTYSIGGTVMADSMVTLDERHLYIGQKTDNSYIRTKFIAERSVLAAIAAGEIRGKIMRLGNLMGRESDGEFQMNVGSNAFVNLLKTYKALGVYPLEELAKPLEMSPIDRVAEAICLLATTPDNMCVFQPYNRYSLDMGAVIAAMNALGIEIDTVSRDDFAAHVDALRNDPVHAKELQGILHYAGHLLEKRKMTPVDNSWTTTVLYRLGFRWKPAEDNYLSNFFTMLDGLGVFD